MALVGGATGCAGAARVAESPAVEVPVADRALRYQVRYEPGALAITLRLTGDASGQTALSVPTSWAGQSRFNESIEGLSATTGGGIPVAISPGDGPGRRILTHAPGEALEVRYRVHEPHREMRPLDRRLWPYLAAEYFTFLGHAALIGPARGEALPVPITLEWEGLPESWSLANSFGAGERRQEITQSLSNLRHAVFTAGDFRLTQVDVRGRPVQVAIRGAWRFTDAAFVGLVQKVLTAERAFWADDDFPFYLVTLQPLGSCCAYGGSGLSNSFAMTVASDQGLGPHMTHLLTHETFHAWNGQRIRREAPEEQHYWFSEGFTNYYARLLSLRAGLLDLRGYAADLDEALYRYTTSPNKNAPLASSREAFWKDEAGHRLPYDRGDLLAVEWNARIRARSAGRASLDDFMRDFLSSARDRGTLVSAESVDALLRPYLPEGVADEIERVNVRGESLEPRPDALGPCFSLERRKRDSFSLGFARSTLDTHVVTGLEPGGPADRAGLREGQRIVAFHFAWNDPAELVKARVRDSRGEHDVTFYPRGPAIDVPFYRLDEKRYIQDPAACLAWFGVDKPND